MFADRETTEGAPSPLVERMEERRLLAASVTLVDGDLIVAGTSQDDEVIFFLNKDGTKVKVDLNGEVFAFDRASVDQLRASVKGGDDFVKVSHVNGVLDLSLKARGGDDHDTLIGGDLADKLFGEEGDDLLRGRGGIDTLFGDDGIDLLDGGIELDVIWGGLGDDAEFDFNDALYDLNELDYADGLVEVQLQEVDAFLDALHDLRDIDGDGDEEDLWEEVKDFFEDLF